MLITAVLTINTLTISILYQMSDNWQPGWVGE